MSRREWSLFVADMQEAIEKIASDVDAMTFTDFQSDPRTVDAVVHILLVIGEAARCLPVSIKENHPDIDWIVINGLRNRIAHDYFGLPHLEKQLAAWLCRWRRPPHGFRHWWATYWPGWPQATGIR